MALGFGLGAGGSGLSMGMTKKANELFSRKLPQLSSAFRPSRHGDPLQRFNWAGFGSEQITDRGIGAALSATNSILKGFDDPQSVLNAGLLGGLQGTTGPTISRH